jgi:replicative DNA helicase
MGKANTSGRVPPHNIEAEECVLGAVLLSRAALEDIWRDVAPSDFYKPAHQHIWASILDLRRSPNQVDVVTVADELRKLGLLDEIGGTTALLALQAATPAISNVRRYVTIVTDTAARRALIMAASEIADLGYNEAANDDLLDAARSMLGRVQPARGAVPADLMTVEAFMSSEAQVTRPWVIPGMLRQAHRSIVVGPEGRGKGVLLRQVALAVSQGRHPFAPQVPIEAQRTLYVDLENPPEAVAHQIRLSRGTLERLNGGWIDGMAWLLARENGMDLRTRGARSEIEAVMERVRPTLLVIGPVYKAFRKKGREDHGDVAAEAIAFLDDLRIRFSCAIWLEAHASKGSGGARDMDPSGSQQWLAAPEFGRGMYPAGPNEDKWSKVELRPFRGDRVPANWPTHLLRRNDPMANALPWVGFWAKGGAPDGSDQEPF